MRGKASLFVLTLLAGGSAGLAQTDSPHASNAVYFELLGNGGVLSFNYERLVNDRLALRVGYGAWNNTIIGPSDTQKASSIPVSASYLFGPGERKLEIGGGITFGHIEDLVGNKSSFRSLTAIVGYRKQPAGRGYLFRAGVTPFYSLDSGSEAYPNPGFTFSAGVSFGYRF